KAEAGADILVRPDDAAKAKDLLADLEEATPDELAAPALLSDVGAPPPVGSTPRPYRLSEAESGATVGEITEAQLQFLIDELEEESDDDQSYYIDAATIDMLEAAGGDAELAEMLKRALGSREGVEVAWTKR